MKPATTLPRTNSPSAYELQCHGCPWHVPAPTRYDIAKAMVWAHQRTVAFGPQHAVVFIPADTRKGE